MLNRENRDNCIFSLLTLEINSLYIPINGIIIPIKAGYFLKTKTKTKTKVNSTIGYVN